MKWNETILFIIILPYSRVSRVAANGFMTTFLEHTLYMKLADDIYYFRIESNLVFSMVQYAKINIVSCHAMRCSLVPLVACLLKKNVFGSDAIRRQKKKKSRTICLLLSFFLSFFLSISRYIPFWISQIRMNESISQCYIYIYIYIYIISG